ncbi:hypothetical protein NKG94_17560 [Micromonospora sp. M12]
MITRVHRRGARVGGLLRYLWGRARRKNTSTRTWWLPGTAQAL